MAFYHQPQWGMKPYQVLAWQQSPFLFQDPYYRNILNIIQNQLRLAQPQFYRQVAQPQLYQQMPQQIKRTIKSTYVDGQISEDPPVVATSQQVYPGNVTGIDEVLARTMSQQTGQFYSISDFEVIKKLGQGAFGETFAVRNKRDGTTVVIKRLLKNKITRQEVESEVNILSKLSTVCRSYILCYKGFFEDEQYYYIMTEFLGDYITLDDFIEQRRATYENVNEITRNLLLGLQEMHQMGVAHRDIKPQNILINPQTNQIKYIDFGLSCDQESCPFKTLAGTPMYIAPEVLFNRVVPGLLIFQKGDIWSLGLTIFDLITGRSLFEIYLDRIGYTGNVFRQINDFYSNPDLFYALLEESIMPVPVNEQIKNVIGESLRFPPMERNLDELIRIIL